MKKILLLWLSLMIVALSVQPARAHELKIDEPDHPLQWIEVVFFPVGHLLHHLIFGWGHADTSSVAKKTEQNSPQPQQEPMDADFALEMDISAETNVPEYEQDIISPPPHAPKYNFSPREKIVPQESMETVPVPQEEQQEPETKQAQESGDVYFPPEIE